MIDLKKIFIMKIFLISDMRFKSHILGYNQGGN